MIENLNILDATAGNRTIWKQKNNSHILFIDIEENLDIPPDRIVDCTKTFFSEESFHTIFFDPPHGWGKETASDIYTCRNSEEYKLYKKKYNLNRWGNNAVYYGWDKYASKSELLSFIHKAQKEFYRILTKDGQLWLKWNECNLPLLKILPLLKNWVEMLRLPISNKLQRMGTSQTYWIMLMKRNQDPISDLSDYIAKSGAESTNKEGST